MDISSRRHDRAAPPAWPASDQGSRSPDMEIWAARRHSMASRRSFRIGVRAWGRPACRDQRKDGLRRVPPGDPRDTSDLGSIETLRLGLPETKKKEPSGFAGLVSLRAARGDRSGPRQRPHHTNAPSTECQSPASILRAKTARAIDEAQQRRSMCGSMWMPSPITHSILHEPGAAPPLSASPPAGQRGAWHPGRAARRIVRGGRIQSRSLDRTCDA